MSNIFIRTSEAEDWKKFLAEPEKQWKRGYSARAMAYCWTESDGLPKNINKVLSKLSGLQCLETLLVIPEHQVPLPGGTRPSQNDVWVLARTANDLISIAVEGKVSEPFGPTIGEWLLKASPGKKKRYRFLCAIYRISLEDL